MKVPMLIVRRGLSSGNCLWNKAGGGVKSTPPIPKPAAPVAKPVTPPVAAAAAAQPAVAKLNAVKGLSAAVLGSVEPVGPGAARNGEYKVPEYFNFNKSSYFEAEVEMAQYRCAQPSSLRK